MLAGLSFAAAMAQVALLTSFPEPSDALARALHGYSSRVKLTISPTGLIRGCTTVNSGGSAALDKVVCAYLLTANASAAKTADGTRAYSEVYVNMVGPDAAHIPNPPDVDLTVDRLPKGSPIHPKTSLILTIDPEGHVMACDVKVSSGVAALDQAACKSGPTAAPPAPINDEKGAPALSVKLFQVSFGVYTPVVLSGGRFGNWKDYTPERAVRLGVTGSAALACTSMPDGKLEGCTVVEEGPFGFDFGRAALMMAKDGAVQVASGSPGQVLVRVDFH